MSYHTPRGFQPIYADPNLPHQIVIREDFYSCNCLRRGQAYTPIGKLGAVAEMRVGYDDPDSHCTPFDVTKHGLGVRPENQPSATNRLEREPLEQQGT